MFYNTGTTFDIASGSPDTEDGNTLKGDVGAFGTVTINAGKLTLTPLDALGSPFEGMLLYQRRSNTAKTSIQTKVSGDLVEGTIYARWSNVALSGPGSFNAQLIIGSLQATGPGALVNIDSGGKRGKAYKVYLVE